VFIDDAKNKRRVKVPASVAAVTAYGMNDKIAYPWYAPAGFNRAALDFVTNVNVRLNSSDRDTLSDVRINPIASFPRQGFVIFGQKTLQQAKSALDRVNVRRLLLEVKRIVNDAAQKIVFEQNTAETRASFVKETTTAMGLIQAAAGLESFRVIMNSTNNTADDADANKVNGRIVIVPTRTIESIALDFVITSSGVSFV
jgi:phage tail sheath protein FI